MQQLRPFSLFLASVLLSIVTLSISGNVFAQENDARAQAMAHHQRGLELYQAGSYTEAAQAFESAQALAPAPSNLFNLAHCYEQLGDMARAITILEQYVAGDLDAERRDRGQAELARLRALSSGGATPPAAGGAEVDLIIISEPDSAEVLVDGRPQVQRTPAVVTVQPGTRMVEVRREGYLSARQEVEVQAGRAARIELTLEVAPEGETGGGGEPRDERRVRFTFGGQIGGGASLVISGPATASHSGLIDLNISGGLEFGSPRTWRTVTYSPVRLELVADVALMVNQDIILEAGGGGRLSLALFSVPFRIEGELGGLWYKDFTHGTGGVLSISLQFLFQIRNWLEVGLRALRGDIAFIKDEDSTEVRWGIDALVRFRL